MIHDRQRCLGLHVHHVILPKQLLKFLADRNTAGSMIGYWHDTVVCHSVCPSVRPRVCDDLYCGAQGGCRGCKLYRGFQTQPAIIYTFYIVDYMYISLANKIVVVVVVFL